MNSKAIRKQLLAAVAMVLVAAVALGSSTYAWFAANTKVQATGMQATATTSSSLVISNESNVGTKTAHGFTSNTTQLIPASHLDASNTPASGTNTSNLVEITNANAVDAQTGYAAKIDTPLAYAYAENVADNDSTADVDETKNYYIDYVCYIASAGSPMEKQDIKVKITDAAAATLATYNAASIDFYAEQLANPATVLNIGSYKGTLNKAQLNSTTNDGTTPLNEVTLLSDVTIPKNGQTTTNVENAYIRVTMRVYIDGDLKQSASANEGKGQAYVYSNVVDVTSATMNVEFEAIPHPTGT